MSIVTIGDSFLAQIIKNSVNCIRGVYSQRRLLRLIGHLFYCQNIHLLILKPKILTKYITERLGRTINWKILGWVISQNRRHVNNGGFLQSFFLSGLELGSKESAHEGDWEAI